MPMNRAALRACGLVAGALLALGLSAAYAQTWPAESADPTVARVFELTNLERERAGARPLLLSPELTAAAQEYSVVMASSSCFAHTCAPMPDLVQRAQSAGYVRLAAVAENIAAGYPTPEAVMVGWMGSAAHRANLLSSTYTDIGIGVATGGDYGIYWTENFAARAESPTSARLEASPDGQSI
ncbi:MAG: CAP domain-containing protein [Chloroflexota bacterium]|nr:CAP domain-containing protein [Chloroflexota bacterium]